MNTKYNPDMLKIARESRNLTQQELAEKIGIPQVIVSKIEAGLKIIDENLMDKFVDVLRYPSTFFEHTFQSLDMGARLHRKKSSLSRKDENFIDAQASIRNIFISELLNRIDIDVHVPEMLLSDFENPEKIAEELRRIWDIPKGFIGNMTKTLEAKGIFICELDFPVKTFDAVSFYNKKNNYGVILINKNFSPDRYRFTLAHELGHLIMHRNFPSATAEEEANSFAAAFLMPEKDIIEDLKDLHFWDLSNLKAIWKVSMAALIYRAKELKCIDEKKYNSLQVRLSQQGYKKSEPSCGLEIEKPSMFKDILDYYYNELNFDEITIRKMFGVYKDDYRNICYLLPTINIKPKNSNLVQLKLV